MYLVILVNKRGSDRFIRVNRFTNMGTNAGGNLCVEVKMQGGFTSKF
jgi:hypothetical protein